VNQEVFPGVDWLVRRVNVDHRSSILNGSFCGLLTGNWRLIGVWRDLSARLRGQVGVD